MLLYNIISLNRGNLFLISDIVIILILIIIKGILTATSNSLSIIELKKTKYFSDKDNANYNKLAKIIKRSHKDANTASVLNAFFGIMIGFVLAFNVYNKVYNILERKIVDFTGDNLLKIITAIIILVVTTYLFALFSLIIPKMFAEKYPDKIVLKFDGVLHILSVILTPFILLLDVVVKLINVFVKAEKQDVSEEEILMMVDVGSEQGNIDEDEMEMINNIFEFDDKNCVEIATHRKDIVAISRDIGIDELIDVVANNKFSRIPVYNEDIDDIVGILHVKDFMNMLITKGRQTFNIEDIIMEPYFVPSTKKTDDLFSEMKKKKIHMAVVADEYGGTAGIVTMEDLIEEVMGEIQDEYDEEEEPEIEEVTENITRIEGSANLEDVAKSLEIDMPVDEYDTLGGFLIAKLDRIPDDGERDIEIEYENCVFRIDKVEDKRIVNVTVTKSETAK